MKHRTGDRIQACGQEYSILRLLGHGKGGYSYLVTDGSEARLDKRAVEELQLILLMNHRPTHKEALVEVELQATYTKQLKMLNGKQMIHNTGKIAKITMVEKSTLDHIHGLQMKVKLMSLQHVNKPELHMKNVLFVEKQEKEL